MNTMQGKRYPHFLRTATGGEWPDKVICLDCVRMPTPEERDPSITRYKLWHWWVVCLRKGVAGYDRTTNRHGVLAGSFWSQLYRFARTTGQIWIFSHRAADQWAMLGGWDEVETGRATIGKRSKLASALPYTNIMDDSAGALVLEDPPFILRFRIAGRPAIINWICTINYGALPSPDCKQGEATACWVADWYCEYHRLCDKYELGSLRPTVGAQSMHGFKCSYYTGGIYNHVHQSASDLESAAYVGGRSEPYRFGVCPPGATHMDYRSLYPAICVSEYLPIRLVKNVSGNGMDAGRSTSVHDTRIARVRVRTEESAYPVRHNGQVIWPVGEFDTVLHEPELQDAEEHGRVIKYYEMAIYESSPALASYANAIYKMRCDAEQSLIPGISAMAKLMCVALPGKFGQRSYKWITTDLFHDYHYYGQWDRTASNGSNVRLRSIAGIVQCSVDMGIAPDSNLAIAGYITSAGRRSLLSAIRVAGWDNVYYVDTDSIFCNEQGYSNLVIGGMVTERTLGKLDVKARSVHLEVRGVKYYVENGKVVCAGMPIGRHNDCGDGEQYRYRDSAIHQAINGRRPVASETIVRYHRDVLCTHRIVHEDGSTEPIRLGPGGLSQC